MVGKPMKHFTVAFSAVLACVSLSHAQSADPPPEEDIVNLSVMPGAVQALDDMAEFLRDLEQFRLTAHATREDVLEGELKVQIGSVVTYDVMVPDKMKLEVKSDQQWRVYYYDGATVTQYAPSLGFYSVFAAGPTIAETIDIAFDDYGVSMPLADLFFWGTERSNVENLTMALYVGQARIDGQTCDHYAYRARDADFQVWIAKRGDPLPCRLVVTTTDDPARPQYAATLSWDLDPLLTGNMFSFSPSPGDSEIDQEEIETDN